MFLVLGQAGNSIYATSSYTFTIKSQNCLVRFRNTLGFGLKITVSLKQSLLTTCFSRCFNPDHLGAVRGSNETPNLDLVLIGTFGLFLLHLSSFFQDGGSFILKLYTGHLSLGKYKYQALTGISRYSIFKDFDGQENLPTNCPQGTFNGRSITDGGTLVSCMTVKC